MKESLHKKLMIRIGALLTVLILSFFVVVNFYVSRQQKNNLITTGYALSTLILQKATENLQRAGGSLLALTALSLDLKRTVDGSDSLVNMAFVSPSGDFIAHSNTDKINTRAPEEFLEITEKPEIIDMDTVRYILYPLKQESLRGLKLVVGFSKKGISALSSKYLGIQIVILFAALIVAYFASSSFIQSQVLKPLERLRRHSVQLRNGDLTHYAKVLSEDEIGELTEAFNDMTENIRGIIEKITSVSSELTQVASSLSSITNHVKNAIHQQGKSFSEMEEETERVSESATEVAEKMQHMHASVDAASSSVQEMSTSLKQVETEMKNLQRHIDEVSGSIELIRTQTADIAARAESLLMELEETGASITQIASSTREVENMTQEGTRIAVKAADISKEGMKAAEEANTSMKKIHDIIHQVTDSVETLEKRTERIREILDVIQGIAGQTNLLAINASIIASQAGEHGKSFAVVAEHIKNLASRTAASTRDIETIIKSVSGDVAKTVELVSIGLESVEEGQKLSARTLKVLKKLEEANIQTARTMEMIARAMAENTRGIHRLMEANSKINAHANEIVKSTREQADAADKIATSSARMKSFSEEVLKASQEQSRAGEDILRVVEEVAKSAEVVTQAAEDQKERLLNTLSRIARGVKTVKEVAQEIDEVHATSRVLHELSEMLSKEVKKFKL